MKVSLISYCGVVVLLGGMGAVYMVGQSPAATKKVVHTAADLPQFSYPVSEGSASALLASNDKTFDAFARKVGADVNATLAGYQIEDRATLRELFADKVNVDLLTGNFADALATLQKEKGLQDKPSAKLMTGMLARALVGAREETGSTRGPAYEAAFQKRFAAAVDQLPWAVVQDSIKSLNSSMQILSPDLISGNVKQNLDPQVAKSGSLSFAGAESLVGMRVAMVYELPVAKAAVSVLKPYIVAHDVQKPDIWAGRSVTLHAGEKLTPVRIGIFDSGVDTSLYPKQLFVDPHPGAHSSHGLAYDVHGKLFDADLQPLTAAQKAAYPKMLKLFQGLDDLQNNIDSPEADATRKTLSSTPPDQLAADLKMISFFGQWMHGTHVAGIAVRGNPAARLVVAQFYDSLPDIPFAPTVAWAERFKADFQQVGEYFRDHNVRVVNMSWGDSQGEIEEWLSKTSTEKDANVRKQLAGKIYAVWREAVAGAIKAAPHTLFVCAAGNSDSNAGFLGDVPASLKLPNLVSVGAVDQAGDVTSFTSYGSTVVLDADGFRVESYVPGGTRLKESGTSMASPNVVNLAAKLIALDPKLTPEETITLMEKGADTSANGKLHLINPKATVALLQRQEGKTN